MLAKTHLISALAVASLPLVLGYETDYDSRSILYFIAVMIGSLAPDLDEHKSFIGKRFYMVSFPLKEFIGHRTFTHNIFVSIIGALLSMFYFESIIAFGFFLGVFVHIIGDAMTGNVKGALWPVRKKFYALPKKYIIRVGGIGEHMILTSLSGFLLFEHIAGAFL